MATLSILKLVGCNNNDDTNDPPEAQNHPPEAFDLIGVTNGAQAVDVIPAFSWQPATDPDGDTISYDLYLGTDSDAIALYADGIGENSFIVKERLHLATEYFWKVVAKDGNGENTESAVHSFTTRNLDIPASPMLQPAPFQKRSAHGLVVFDDKLWLVGGQKNAVFENDVWFSDDGITWTEATIDAGFSERRYVETVAFKDKIWVLGGGTSYFDLNNDVWSSGDGFFWTVTVPAGFSKRWLHSAVVFDDKLWVIGGFDSGGYKNDVWSSSDGINWSQTTPSAAFPARSLATVTFFDERLWLIGGYGGTTNAELADVWVSSDGINWGQATANAAFPPRSGHTTVHFDNKLWVIGGYDKDGGFKNDLWYSEDGTEWHEVTSDAPFGPRSGHASAVFKDRIWVLGGDGGAVVYDDVWAMD